MLACPPGAFVSGGGGTGGGGVYGDDIELLPLAKSNALQQRRKYYAIGYR